MINNNIIYDINECYESMLYQVFFVLLLSYHLVFWYHLYTLSYLETNRMLPFSKGHRFALSAPRGKNDTFLPPYAEGGAPKGAPGPPLGGVQKGPK